jgi:serine/threonine protein kinase
MENYHILGRIGEGAHGIVYKAKRIQSGDLVALKKVPLRNLEDGFPTEVRVTLTLTVILIHFSSFFSESLMYHCKNNNQKASYKR